MYQTSNHPTPSVRVTLARGHISSMLEQLMRVQIQLLPKYDKKNLVAFHLLT